MPATPNYLLRYPDSHEATFEDTLLAYNGFARGRAWIDLRPGMKLRIENAYYEPGASRRGVKGFLGTEVAEYKFGPNGELKLLSVQPMAGRPEAQKPVQELIPQAHLHHRYFRFYYEILFKASGNSRGSVLLSADTESEFNRLAAELMSDPDAACSGQSTGCALFPEACSVSVEMEIVVNHSPQTVGWGSVLSSIAANPRHLEMWRLQRGRLTRVRLNPQDAGALRLPLLPGDHVVWN